MRVECDGLGDEFANDADEDDETAISLVATLGEFKDGSRPACRRRGADRCGGVQDCIRVASGVAATRLLRPVPQGPPREIGLAYGIILAAVGQRTRTRTRL